MTGLFRLCTRFWTSSILSSVVGEVKRFWNLMAWSQICCVSMRLIFCSSSFWFLRFRFSCFRDSKSLRSLVWFASMKLKFLRRSLNSLLTRCESNSCWRMVVRSLWFSSWRLVTYEQLILALVSCNIFKQGGRTKTSCHASARRSYLACKYAPQLWVLCWPLGFGSCSVEALLVGF